MEAEGPAIYTVLQDLDVGSHTSNTICASFAGLCEYPEVREYDLTFPSPKPANKTRPPPSGKAPLRVAHISDTHIDLHYTAGSNAECTKPICCRVYDPADAPGNTTSPCGPWGHVNCDTPERLAESMVTAVEGQAPDFSIYTGDVAAHNIWNVDQREVLADFNTTYSLLDRLGLVFAAVGNHDTAPANIFPPTASPHNKWAYDALLADWEAMAPIPDSSAKDTHLGSYAAALDPSGRLRVISYNSIYYYTFNFAMYSDPMAYDPTAQFAWLIAQLDEAESLNQRVWLIAHIPSGSKDTFHDASHYLDQIINRYEATIAALFFGHTHTDQLQLSYSDYTHRTADTASAVGYITSSLAPTSGPASFRVYDVDPETFGVLDYTMYIANISSPGAQDADGPAWVPYYSAKAAYGSALSPPVTDPAAELTPAFWHNVTEAMQRDESVFQAWWERRTRGYKVPECSGECVDKEICGIRGADAQFSCVETEPGISITKRETEEDGSCDEGGGGLLLARIMRLGARKHSDKCR